MCTQEHNNHQEASSSLVSSRRKWTAMGDENPWSSRRIWAREEFRSWQNWAREFNSSRDKNTNYNPHWYNCNHNCCHNHHNTDNSHLNKPWTTAVNQWRVWVPTIVEAGLNWELHTPDLNWNCWYSPWRPALPLSTNNLKESCLELDKVRGDSHPTLSSWQHWSCKMDLWWIESGGWWPHSCLLVIITTWHEWLSIIVHVKVGDQGWGGGLGECSFCITCTSY